MPAEWYYTTNKQQMGPVSWAELRELAEVGILKPHDMVWSEGMDEWVKAINQSGLFADDEEAVTADPKAKKKPTYVDPPKPPPGRRTRKKEEEEEEEDDERESKRKARKREEDRAKMGVGVRVALGIGAVLGLLLLGACVCGGLFYMTLGGDRPRPGPPPAPGPGPGPVAGGLVRDNFVWNNLNERFHNEKAYRFTAGKRVTITVTNTLTNPNTNVDLMVFRGGNANQNQNAAFQWDRRRPQEDRNCRLDFIVPANDTYWVRVANFGPGIVNSSAVSVIEQ
ncbi:MAG TPA: DUF4339 domain-containing protein [Gemmataceae bacterium]|nr:DUF4339 domain-containing protein [Gemmataceae bacterium]